MTPPKLELDWRGDTPNGAQSLERAPEVEMLAGKGPPGDPRYMSAELRSELGAILEGSWLSVRQQFERLQMWIGWDQPNQYVVRGSDTRVVLYAGEERGIWSNLARNFNPFHQRHIECLTLNGTRAMTIDFPFRFLLRRGEVQAWDGRPMGYLQERFHLLRTILEVQSPNGATQLVIRGPWLKLFSFSDWVFDVTQGERVVARIKKHWSGWLRESLGTSDNFSIEFEPQLVDPRLRQLLVAAALTLDLVRFEQRGNPGTAMRLLGG
jgi:uncharacterized protein YxjI